jgi:hypothetical protein
MMPKKGERGEPFAIQVLPDGSERIVDRMGGFSNSYLHPGAAKRLITCANVMDGMEPDKLTAFIEAATVLHAFQKVIESHGKDCDHCQAIMRLQAAYRGLMGGEDAE